MTMIYLFITLTLLKTTQNKLIRSLAQGEVVQFDIVMNIKNMQQATNVTGPNDRVVNCPR